MGRELLTVLGAESDAASTAQVPLSDERLQALYESLLLTRLLDATCARLQGEGRLGFFVPALPAAAASAGAASVLEDDDWLLPSFRDTSAFLVRGGTIDGFMAQVLGAADEPLKGRQLPAHGSLPGGRFVAPSGLAGAQVQHAAGVGLAKRLRGDGGVALALFGPAAVQQGAFHTGLGAAVRHRAQAVFVCRTTGAERPLVADLAAGAGAAVEVVDGGDCLAVATATHAARQRALAAEGPTLIEAVLRFDGDDGVETDPAHRLRPFVEQQGLWDAEHEEDFIARCQERIRRAVDAVSPGTPAARTLFEDVWSEAPWMLREQAARLGIDLSRETDDE